MDNTLDDATLGDSTLTDAELAMRLNEIRVRLVAVGFALRELVDTAGITEMIGEERADVLDGAATIVEDMVGVLRELGEAF